MSAPDFAVLSDSIPATPAQAATCSAGATWRAEPSRRSRSAGEAAAR
jgi:hypothetical protein